MAPREPERTAPPTPSTRTVPPKPSAITRAAVRPVRRRRRMGATRRVVAPLRLAANGSRSPGAASPRSPAGVDARRPSRHERAMLVIRAAEAADVPLILRLIRELAAYEREPDAVVATEADLLRDGFGPTPRFQVLIAEDAGEPAGFAFYCFAYSTWRGRPVLYLEDLFVLPEHRKKGIGLALMRRLARIAVDSGCARFVWEVLDWNEPAIRFYESLGAEVLRSWLNVRMEGEALARLAE